MMRPLSKIVAVRVLVLQHVLDLRELYLYYGKE